ncbi:ATP-binding cassette domain-containing protein [Streptomyces sp. FXJ1.172]|uniref:ABC transporter ATP-binding protein n=1 Tax=Streptomyces sp. FXJ1.172 TaxID=710705 RepID=UPI0007CFF8EF|nr:ABC transporter ATP-binding protein [Streptomyces sp. FXJ1.172]WEO94838.1 ATP-binding cassette domain-containing protein [Streptomyces sp. FXJ1.172]
MIQAFGLTSQPRKAHPPAVDDVSFEARAGHVTALLGGAGAGKTTALRLMLELQPGRGITYFRGRPLHRIPHPSREVGVLLGDVPGHPARSVRGHLRMLCAAAGVPVRRADEVLEVVGLVSLREERLGTLSRGMDRRLGLACALLPDPHALVLDDPADGLSAHEAQWLHDMLRAHAQQGGTVVFTTADPKEAARTADRVVTLDSGRLRADQDARDFARTRLRPRVAVRSPHAARLATLLTKEARTARRSVEVVREDGNLLLVYGSTTADIGETAFRHGILVHQLADEIGEMGSGAGIGPGIPSAEADDVVADEPRARRAHDAAAASATAEPETAAPGLQVQEPGTSTLDSSASGTVVSEPPAPKKAAVAFGFSSVEAKATTSGVTAGDRGTTPAGFPVDGQESTAVDASAPEPVIPGRPSQEDVRTVSAALVPGERAPATGGERSTLGEAPCLRSEARHTGTARDTSAEGSSPGGALLGAEGTNAGAVPVKLLAGAEAERTADATALSPSNGTVVAVQESQVEPQARSTSAPAAGFAALRARLPGARSPGIRRPRTAHADQPAGHGTLDALSPLPPPISVRPGPSPLRPVRYEIRRATGIGVGFVTCGAVLAVSALIAVLLARLGHTPQARLFAAWPRELPLPPAALAAGLLGALAFGDEFRHPALAADRGTVPRRLGLLTAKLLVSGAAAVLLAFLTVGCDAEALYIVYGQELTRVPADWLSLGASWFGLVLGCAWAGVLAAGVFRSTTGGLAAVLAVPVVVVPLVHGATHGPAQRMAAGLPERVREVFLLQWPFGGDRYLLALARVLAQPVGGALALSLAALLCAYLFTTLRTRFR